MKYEIVLTGDSEEELKIKAMEAGADFVCKLLLILGCKPLSCEALETIIKKIFAKDTANNNKQCSKNNIKNTTIS